MKDEYIYIKGAKEHNLKNIDLKIPRNTLTVITGISGSGKSSLAFDTIYAEGQRQYVESLSAYARQFLEQLQKPDVEYIEGLSPAIAIEQRTAGSNPRSTVGTQTEIYDYLRLLFARVGTPYCYRCGRKISSQISLIQVAGRAARNINGKIIMYADILTGSMKRAIRETDRRRKVQLEYNELHHIEPATIKKEGYIEREVLKDSKRK